MKLRNSDLKAVLKSHGLESITAGEWLQVNGTLPAIRCAYSIASQGSERHTATVLIQVKLEEGRIVDESFAGMGETAEQAFLNGMTNFCLGSLRVFLAAVWGKLDKEQVTLDQWSFHGKTWDVYAGSFIRRAFNGENIAVPESLFPQIESEIKKSALGQEMNWVRMFYCRLDQTNVVSEFLINNEKAPDSEKAIKAVDWPKAPYIYTVRQFLMLKRRG